MHITETRVTDNTSVTTPGYNQSDGGYKNPMIIPDINNLV
jgi:hypothetical protein